VKRYRNHHEVPLEVEAVARWYDDRDAGLGVEFVLAVEAAVAKICAREET
jgi:hypothetical protein